VDPKAGLGAVAKTKIRPLRGIVTLSSSLGNEISGSIKGGEFLDELSEN